MDKDPGLIKNSRDPYGFEVLEGLDGFEIKTDKFEKEQQNESNHELNKDKLQENNELNQTMGRLANEVLDDKIDDGAFSNNEIIEDASTDSETFDGGETLDESEQDPTAWQQECFETIRRHKNVILSSPTGSGKTRVFMQWAQDKKEQAEKLSDSKHTIYITAPIKALSNQRFRELREQGLNVGLETGDIKKVPKDADYICCTQEIYTNKYLENEQATLIMDEFHYIFESENRARTYIDSLHKTKAQNVLLASATFGDTEKFHNYVNKVSERDFLNYENDKRITELEYVGKLEDNDEIKNALIVTFSARNCKGVVEYLARNREGQPDEVVQKIHHLAEQLKISDERFLRTLESGVAPYYGAMLPKEKFLVEKLFEERLIDSVVGTDALALGVNFPVEKVVFAQLAKYYDGPISKNLFEQLSGRAGRKGYYDRGSVYYVDYNLEAFNYETEHLFDYLLYKENEDAEILLTPNIKELLTGKVTVDEEAEYITKFSTDGRSMNESLKRIEQSLEFIKKYSVADLVKGSDMERSVDARGFSEAEILAMDQEFQENIGQVYFDEFGVDVNCSVFTRILMGDKVEDMIEPLIKYYNPEERGRNLSSMLQLRKYLRQLPKKYRKGMIFSKIDQAVNNIDDTALNIDRLDLEEFKNINKNEVEE